MKRKNINNQHPGFLTKYWNKFRFDVLWNCKFCNTESARFTNIDIDTDGEVRWNFNCRTCGSNFQSKLDYPRFKKLHVNYGNSRDRTNITEYGMKYQIFLTAMEYDDFFATGEDKENYYSLLERLRTDCTGLMKYWNFLTERWQHAFN